VKISPFLAAVVFSLVLSGCASMDKTRTPPLSPLEVKLRDAAHCRQAGDFQKAFIFYCELQNNIDDQKEYQKISLLKADLLLQMQNYPAALASLAPIPELPATLYDCKKLILASRILQKLKGNPDHIEALLEVALDNSIHESGVIFVKASGYAELGKIYIKHKKSRRAIKCFEYAAMLYDQMDDSQNADACRNIMEYLQ